ELEVVRTFQMNTLKRKQDDRNESSSSDSSSSGSSGSSSGSSSDDDDDDDDNNDDNGDRSDNNDIVSSDDATITDGEDVLMDGQLLPTKINSNSNGNKIKDLQSTNRVFITVEMPDGVNVDTLIQKTTTVALILYELRENGHLAKGTKCQITWKGD